MFHRLFDGHPDLFIYPVDISVFYAYFPYFTTELAKHQEQLKRRLHLVITKSLQSYSEHLREKKLSASEFATKVVDTCAASELLTSKNGVLKTIANSWIEYYYASEEKKPIVFKETSQAIFFPAFQAESSQFKMISLIRDPRDNYAAIKSGVESYYSKMGEGNLESLASVINRVKMDLKSAMTNQEYYPSDFMAVKFEELVSDTERVMRSISDFLSIGFHDTLITPTSFGENYHGNNFEGVKFAGLGSVNVNRWPERITENEAGILEYWLADLMNYWGYELRVDKQRAQSFFAEFYEWYNTKYFYKDSFK